MKIRELVKEIVDDTLTDSEILKYCNDFEVEVLKELLLELSFEEIACERVGDLNNAQKLHNDYNLICKYFNMDYWKVAKCLNPEPQQVQQEQEKILLPEKLITFFEITVNKGLMEKDGNKYKWINTNSLYGYFVDKVSDKLNLKSSSNRIRWKLFEGIVTNHKSMLPTAKQAVNDYKNKSLNPPEGDDIVNDILKDL